ncbi:muellerian-inhibiting factor [Odontesthes bonariensis]|uniref:muellerian-inhibiting factor n=1 Tax=Odontesthes bonariensis TaxID=219752 RepID=UPI003F581C4E
MLAVLVIFSSWLGVTVQVQHGQQLSPPPIPAASEHAFPSANAASSPPRNAPCFVDDVVAALREAAGNDGDLADSSLSLFGVCRASDNSSRLLLSRLAEALRRNRRAGLEVLHPAAVLVSEQDDERGAIAVTFDLPRSPLLKLNPVLLFTFESPLTGGDLDVALTGQTLQPHTQSVCLSQGTQHILLTGKPSGDSDEQKWTISIEAKSPNMRQNLKDVLIGGKSGSNIPITPLLLFSGETGPETRPAQGSSQTSFLCELRRFLENVLPQDHIKLPLLPMDSLQSLPPLALGLSSSETMLAGIINSSAPTIFSFTSWGSKSPVQHGQLALSPALLEELGQRLEQSEMQILEFISEANVDPRATERLGRLKELSAFQRKETAAGESQYCAFLLLKALQTVAHAYNMQRKLRPTRAGLDSPSGSNICGLRSLTVSFEKLLLGPQTANINNCQGSCAFPLTNGNNHAVLLNSHVESGNANERAPCCVPVAYDPLEVVDWNAEESFLSIKPDMIVKECGCR